MNLQNAQVSRFPDSFQNDRPEHITIAAVVDAIQNGELREEISKLRDHLRHGRKDEYSRQKKLLPAVTWAGTFSRRDSEHCLGYSYHVVLDLDDVGKDFVIIRALAMTDPNVVACFVSPSGIGLKIIIRVDLSALPEAPDALVFRHVWKCVAEHYGTLFGVKVDASGKDLSRLCYLSHDPDIYFNANAVALPIPAPHERVKTVTPTGIVSDRRLDGALRAACDAVRSAPNGERNSTLVQKAFSMGGLIGMDPETARNALISAGNDAGLDDGEAEEVVPRCMAEGAKSPWSLPADPDQGKRSEGPEYNGGQFIYSDRGIFYQPPGEDKSGNPHPQKWLCSPVSVLASTRDSRNHSWGRLLQWADGDGHIHRWAMGSDLLQTDGADVRRMLASRGLAIAPSRQSRELMQVFLQTWPAPKRARCVDKTGWCGPAFVAPDRVFGEADELVVFQGEGIDHGWSTRGNLETWNRDIGALCQGNTRLVLAVSLSLAGPLLDLVGGEGGGFHLRGPSSSGKTTAQLLAASVWGRPKEFYRSWRATANALESVAAMSNDHILILDEIGQVDPKAAGEAAYMLANGSGKSRANRSGGARKAASWRLVYLSSGELPLSELMSQAGHRVHAGQEVRLCDIAADAGAEMGLFEDIHGHATPERFAVHLKTAADSTYGALGPAFLEAIVPRRVEIAESVKAGIDEFAAENTPEGASGQVGRVARRFGLIAAAGELAIGLGLLPWPEGEADKASAACLKSWLTNFGTGQREDIVIISQVQKFIEANGSSRFESMTAGEKVINRVGFWRDVNGVREYLVLSESFKSEVCKGLDSKRAARVLADAGLLVPGADGKMSQCQRLPGFDKPRVYVLRHG